MALALPPPASGQTDAAPAVTASEGDVCDRTPAVRDAIVVAVPEVDDCREVSDAHLLAITGTLDLSDRGITALNAGDFDGLTSLTGLGLTGNALTASPRAFSDGLTALRSLRLLNNRLATLPEGVFADLASPDGAGPRIQRVG